MGAGFQGGANSGASSGAALSPSLKPQASSSKRKRTRGNTESKPLPECTLIPDTAAAGFISEHVRPPAAAGVRPSMGPGPRAQELPQNPRRAGTQMQDTGWPLPRDVSACSHSAGSMGPRAPPKGLSSHTAAASWVKQMRLEEGKVQTRRGPQGLGREGPTSPGCPSPRPPALLVAAPPSWRSWLCSPRHPPRPPHRRCGRCSCCWMRSLSPKRPSCPSSSSRPRRQRTSSCRCSGTCAPWRGRHSRRSPRSSGRWSCSGSCPHRCSGSSGPPGVLKREGDSEQLPHKTRRPTGQCLPSHRAFALHQHLPRESSDLRPPAPQPQAQSARPGLSGSGSCSSCSRAEEPGLSAAPPWS